MPAFRSNPVPIAPTVLSERRRALARHRWRYSAQREAVEAVAEATVAAALGDVFGRWAVQIGACQRGLVARAGTLHHVVCAPWGRHDGDLVSDDSQLPLASDSCDAVVLAFALEFTTRPHRLLREADRVLSDRGVLVVVGQSPFGVAAWPRLIGLSGRALPKGTGLVRPGRLRDWLDLLDFEIDAQHAFAAGWPWRGQARRRPLDAFADCYALVARKRVAPITPSRVPFKRPRAVPAPGVVAGNFRNRWERDTQ